MKQSQTQGLKKKAKEKKLFLTFKTKKLQALEK